MAWYTGANTAAKGAMITLLDTELVKNSHWTIFDASAGTNAKVYRCYDPDDGTLFYWYVDDDVSTDYAQTKVYETWDAGTHTGTGGTSTYLSFRHKLGTYNISLDDTQVIYVDTDGSGCHAGFVGRVHAVDASMGQLVAFIGNVTSQTSYLSFGYINATYVKQVLLRGPLGVSTQAFNFVGLYEEGFGGMWCLDLNGEAWLKKGWIYAGNRLLGYIEGIIPLGTTAVFGHGDIITIDGDDWMAIKGTSVGYALIKK